MRSAWYCSYCASPKIKSLLGHKAYYGPWGQSPSQPNLLCNTVVRLEQSYPAPPTHPCRSELNGGVIQMSIMSDGRAAPSASQMSPFSSRKCWRVCSLSGLSKPSSRGQMQDLRSRPLCEPRLSFCFCTICILS